MSELVPFFDDDEQLDDNLLRSIETLLDDNEQSLDGMCCDKNRFAAGKGMVNAPPNSPIMPQYETATDGSAFGFGNQIYQKWSTNESTTEVMPNIAAGPKRNYGNRNNQSRSPHFVKSPVAKKNHTPPTGVPTLRGANIQIAQCQAMLAEKANQLLNQYLRLNYEFLSAQAQILGIPLDQYIRNLLVALNGNQSSFGIPPPPSPTYLYGSPVSPISPVPSFPNAMPHIAAMQQRAFAKQSLNFNNSYTNNNNKKN